MPADPKADQVARSPGGNRICPRTKLPKGECRCHSPKAMKARRSRTKGKVAEREVRRLLGIQASKAQAEEGEEAWPYPIMVQSKSGGFANPIGTRYRKARDEWEGKRPHGNVKPFMLWARPDGMPGGLFVIHGDDLFAIARLLAGGDE